MQKKKESIYLHHLNKSEQLIRGSSKGYLNKNGGVVQLVRISACHAEGREFESRRHRKKAAQMGCFFCLSTFVTHSFELTK